VSALAADPPPLEALTLAGEMEAFARRGFTEHFTAVAGGLRAVNRRTIVPPEDVVIVDFRRFEGVSDPDDMAILYAVEAPGVRGTLVDAFGVYADPVLASVLTRIAMRPPS
jgi:hypothetical protein